MAKLVRAPAHRAGDLGSNPGPGKNFSLNLLTKEKIIFLLYLIPPVYIMQVLPILVFKCIMYYLMILKKNTETLFL